MVIKTIPSNDRLSLDYPDKMNESDVLTLTEPSDLVEAYRSPTISGGEFQNLLIQADNLHALKSLYENPKVKGAVRLCYIDPPFGTGRLFNNVYGRRTSEAEKSFYSDETRGSKYLEALRRRLIFIREILAEDGSIYVHIDWKMAHYLRVIMDEVFGSDHFVNEITRVKCNPKNFYRKGYGNFKDTILFYSKTDDYIWNDSRERFTEEELKRLFQKKDKDGRLYTTLPLHAQDEVVSGETGKAWRGRLPPKGKHWQRPPEELERLDQAGLIEWSSKGNPRRIIYADEAQDRGKKRQDIWLDFKDPAYPEYPTEKNLDMLKVIVNASSAKGDVVLDCYCGAGTTLLASEQLGRRWIGIDNSTTAIETTRKRLEEVKDAKPYSLLVERGMLRGYRGTLVEATRSSR